MQVSLRIAGRLLAAAAAAVFAVVVYVYLTLPDVRALASTNPTTTAFMELRAEEAARDGRQLRHVHRWVPYARISQNLKRAVLVAEDSAFWDHEGVDFQQLREVIRQAAAQGTAVRGASTITQQLAKNLYLSPSRDPLRKVRELVIARRLEAELTKTRIFEIYLNVIEWGDGIWGIEAAARTYFGIPAAELRREQAALLAGAIINPRVLTPGRPTSRLLQRQRMILGRMGQAGPPPSAARVVGPAAPESETGTETEVGAAPAVPAEAAPAGVELEAAPAAAPTEAVPTEEIQAGEGHSDAR